MAGGGGERTSWTPYIIYALAAIQGALGTYVGAQRDDQKALQGLDLRISALENTIPIRRQMRDQQMQDIVLRVQHLEEHGR